MCRDYIILHSPVTARPGITKGLTTSPTPPPRDCNRRNGEYSDFNFQHSYHQFLSLFSPVSLLYHSCLYISLCLLLSCRLCCVFFPYLHVPITNTSFLGYGDLRGFFFLTDTDRAPPRDRRYRATAERLHNAPTTPRESRRDRETAAKHGKG